MSKLDQIIELIDTVNGEDPNMEIAEGKEWPKELLYSYRMKDMLTRYVTDPDDVACVSMHAQHIQRWKSPRSAYSMDRKGYHQWRTNLYQFHADTVAALMVQVGYDDDSIGRVKQAVGKKALRSNPDTQLLEDVAGLVFIEHYMQAFADKHPEYDEPKWIDIILKTWKKMSDNAHQFALSGSLQLPEPLVPLIQKAIASQ
ncbi:MAG: DUF4202 domain-containing protein [Gammaproteobacteria bacterium]|nr:DUF4202 domain-containing protein [Gammaproteobacteria bacterium]